MELDLVEVEVARIRLTEVGNDSVGNNVDGHSDWLIRLVLAPIARNDFGKDVFDTVIGCSFRRVES